MSAHAKIVTDAEAGRLQARPQPGAARSPVRPGEHPLGIGRSRDGVLFVPSSYDPARPAPLMLCLHGAGGEARHRIDPIRPAAERDGVILVAPESKSRTWDMLLLDFGPDVARIDEALAGAFELLAVDPKRVAIEGFSDGASYALSLGIANGDLFRYVFGFSPGFIRPPARVGEPRVFVTHGTRDAVLPVSCSRRIVPALRQAGYEVGYREFEGGHEVPDVLLQEAMDRLAGRHGAVDPGA
jgi:predicted esterase